MNETPQLRKRRPLDYPKPDDLRKVIQEYFNKTSFDQLSITGLALAMGGSRQLLIDYGKRESYREIVQEAKLIIENSYELSLRKNGKVGDIFALKNFGWMDSYHIHKEVDGKRPRINLERLSKNEREAWYWLLEKATIPEEEITEAQIIE